MQGKILFLASASPRRHEILKQLQISHSVLQVPATEGDDEPQLPHEPPLDYVRRTAHEKCLRAAGWIRNVPAEQLSEWITNRYVTRGESATVPGGQSISTRLHDIGPGRMLNPYILSADTTVVLDGKILGKPENHADAAQTLRYLSGKTHNVYTALALRCAHKVYEGLSVSTVSFKTLSDAEINNYCSTGDPMDKAGAYGIQGPAATFISHMSGSYTGIMGLPAYETSELLIASGWYSRGS